MDVHELQAPVPAGTEAVALRHLIMGFRSQFADQLYDLHNSGQAGTQRTIRFTTVREDFPPNLDDLGIEHMVPYFARMGDTEPEIQVSGLYFMGRERRGGGRGGRLNRRGDQHPQGQRHELDGHDRQITVRRMGVRVA